MIKLDYWAVLIFSINQLLKVDEAEKHFQETIRLLPEVANVHYYLAEILKRKGLSADQVYHLNEAIRINPEYKYKDKSKIKNNISE